MIIFRENVSFLKLEALFFGDPLFEISFLFIMSARIIYLLIFQIKVLIFENQLFESNCFARFVKDPDYITTLWHLC